MMPVPIPLGEGICLHAFPLAADQNWRTVWHSPKAMFPSLKYLGSKLRKKLQGGNSAKVGDDLLEPDFFQRPLLGCGSPTWARKDAASLAGHGVLLSPLRGVNKPFAGDKVGLKGVSRELQPVPQQTCTLMPRVICAPGCMCPVPSIRLPCHRDSSPFQFLQEKIWKCIYPCNGILFFHNRE